MVAAEREEGMRNYDKVEDYFHNYEHSDAGLTHCHSEGKHSYTIEHYHGKHKISAQIAVGHGKGNKPVKFRFTKKLGDGWELSSGVPVHDGENWREALERIRRKKG